MHIGMGPLLKPDLDGDLHADASGGLVDAGLRAGSDQPVLLLDRNHTRQLDGQAVLRDLAFLLTPSAVRFR